MDRLIKFMFDGMPVRGMIVRLGDGWREAMRRRETAGDGGHAFAPAVRALLGEMAAASVLMHANLKFSGALVLQIDGDGPVRLAVAETRSDLGFRVTAKVVGPTPDAPGLAALVNRRGRGRCAVTLDQTGRRPGQPPYQGVVPMHAVADEPFQRLSDVLEHFMRQSEQLDTRLVLAADDAAACGLLLQRLPSEGGSATSGRDRDDERTAEDHARIATLTATLTPAELLALEPQEVLRRLYWDEPIRVFAPLHPRFGCTCSRERVASMLRSLGEAEVRSIVDERGEVEVACDFCGALERFDAVDAAGLFAGAASPTGPTPLQ